MAACHYRDPLSTVRDKLEASSSGALPVVNDAGVMVGLLRGDAPEGDGDTEASELMREGPTTIRPSEDLPSLTERMRKAGVDALYVTSSDGRLLGLLERADAERLLSERGG